MKRNFLIGNFLPAYVSFLPAKSSGRPRPPAFAPEDLAERFAARRQRAAERRIQYRLGIRGGLVTALLLVTLAFYLPFQPERHAPNVVASAQEVVMQEEIQQTQQMTLPPPPPRPALLAVVPDDAVLDDVSLDLDAALDLDEPVAAVSAPPPIDDGAGADEEVEPEIFVVVEQPPEIVGGLASLYEALRYPEMARRAAVEGRAVVRVVVNTDGSPSDPAVLRSDSSLLDPAAIEAVMAQEFKPGMQHSRPVRVRMAFPVNFRLSAS